MSCSKPSDSSFKCIRCGTAVQCEEVPEVYYQFCSSCARYLDMVAYTSAS